MIRSIVGRLSLMMLLCGGAVQVPMAEPAPDARPQADPETAESPVFSPEVEAILSNTTESEGYGELEKCIRVRSIRGTEVLDDRHVVFEMSSQKYYLVQFEYSCHQLRPKVTIAYEPRGSQLCRMDYLRAVDSFGPGSVGPPCSIPGFHSVTREQIALLKESLKAKHKAEVDALKAEKARRKAEKKAAKKAEKEAEMEALPDAEPPTGR